MMCLDHDSRRQALARLCVAICRSAWVSVVPCLLATLAGCGLTSVAAPDVVQPGALNTPDGAVARATAAVAHFATAFSEQALFSGLISDEFSDVTGSFPADRRVVTALQSPNYPYDGLSQVRVDALVAIEALSTYNPTPRSRIGELYAYLGAVELFFAENMCDGVPIGSLQNGVPQPGVPLSHDALLQRAIQDLDSAASNSGGSDSIVNLARVGKGRALADLGQFANAALAVSGVPLHFVFQTAYSAQDAQLNAVAQNMYFSLLMSVSDKEGRNGLPFVSAADPRVPTQNLGPSATGAGTVIGFVPYANTTAPVTIASGVEASLIRAEAALQAGSVTAWADTLNAIRAGAIAPAMVPLTPDSTTSASSSMQVDVMFRERAFWMFATGHRQGDLRRLITQYSRATEATFPTGPYTLGGQQYGADVTFVPFGEQFNANFHGCTDRNP
jgi:hypothetical protein